MSVSVSTAASPPVIYPDSDGEPMADNTKQFRWIVTIHGGLDSIFANDPNVFVAGDLLWYPVEGDNKTRAAPDVMVVFDRRAIVDRTGSGRRTTLRPKSCLRSSRRAIVLGHSRVRSSFMNDLASTSAMCTTRTRAICPGGIV